MHDDESRSKASLTNLDLLSWLANSHRLYQAPIHRIGDAPLMTQIGALNNAVSRPKDESGYSLVLLAVLNVPNDPAFPVAEVHEFCLGGRRGGSRNRRAGIRIRFKVYVIALIALGSVDVLTGLHIPYSMGRDLQRRLFLRAYLESCRAEPVGLLFVGSCGTSKDDLRVFKKLISASLLHDKSHVHRLGCFMSRLVNELPIPGDQRAHQGNQRRQHRRMFPRALTDRR